MPVMVLRGDHGVDDGFLGGLDGGVEERADAFVRDSLDGVWDRARRGRRGWRWRKARKMSPELLPEVEPVRAETHGGAAREALELGGNERRVGGDDDDDGADDRFPFGASKRVRFVCRDEAAPWG